MLKLNKNHIERDEILGIDMGTYNGGIISYTGLTLEKLELLIEKKFVDPGEAQNSAPLIQDMLEFMREHPDFTAHGYAVSPDRSDYRVSIEGLTLKRPPSTEEMIAFTDMFRHADEFSCDKEGCHCWYD